MQSTRSMALDTVIPVDDAGGRRLAWSGRLTLTQRILAVNIFALILLAGSFFYLDSYRARLIDERLRQAQSETRLMATALAGAPTTERPRLLGELAADDKVRLRIVNAQGRTLLDSWPSSERGFEQNIAENAEEQSWQRRVARWMDEAVDFVVRADTPPPFTGFDTVLATQPGSVTIKLAKDSTHVISASAHLDRSASTILLSDRNARDIRRLVRAERARLGYVIAIVSLFSILLSLFLARTIAQPLRLLASAAVSVRNGRDRTVNVPRLPSRNDEIGLLARALSDMTQALRQRIDATEAFAADVAHEIKNPLASLSSAAEGLRNVKKPELREQLQAIIGQDVRRLDRLITDISDLSRIDAKLARTRFEPVDIGALIENILAERRARTTDPVEIAFARPRTGTAVVNGDPAQLTRVIENLLANAVSFSPPDGVVRIAATRLSSHVVLTVDDDGPGIPESAREAIFERFHSDRPEAESFGKHSGLGLSIARTIVNGHDGSIAAVPREPGQNGARLLIRLPLLEITSS